jgi:hypothetical protein
VAQVQSAVAVKEAAIPSKVVPFTCLVLSQRLLSKALSCDVWLTMCMCDLRLCFCDPHVLQGGARLAKKEQLLVMAGNRFEITDYRP